MSGIDAAVRESARSLNEESSKLSLNGVTPAGLHRGVSSVKIFANRQYRKHEQEKEGVPPWKRNYWDVLKEAMRLKQISALELMEKFCFFSPQPLRKIAKLELKAVG